MALPQGKYVVCSFEALAMDALYKVLQDMFGVWLPGHNLQIEPFCAERYQSHSPQTTRTELWFKLMIYIIAPQNRSQFYISFLRPDTRCHKKTGQV